MENFPIFADRIFETPQKILEKSGLTATDILFLWEKSLP
jgi:hypothetical protein